MKNTLPSVEPAPEVQEYLDQKGWWPPPYRSEEPDHVYLDCPFCSSKRLTMQVELGLWDCKSCGEKGNLLGMKRRLGDLYVVRSPGDSLKKRGKSTGAKGSARRPPVELIDGMAERLWDDDEAEPVRKYLTEVRCLPEGVLRKYKIGAAFRHGKWWAALPAFGSDGRPTFLKFRSVPPAGKEFRRFKGCKTVLFGPPPEEPPIDESKPLVIAEGECDVLALVAYGFENVVTGTAGASQGWPEDWIHDARKHENVYLALDRGEDGERGSRKLCKSIGMAKCYRVRPPHKHKDWNECLAAGVSKQDIVEAFEKSEPYRPDEIRDISSYKNELVALRSDPDASRGASFGWEGFDLLLGGVRSSEVTTVTGDTGTGKTTWCSAVAWNLSRMHGWPGLMIPLENRAITVIEKWTRMEAGDDVTDPDIVNDSLFESAFASLESLPLFVLDHWGNVEIEQLCDTIRWASEAEGVRFAVLDHLHYALGVKRDDERHALDHAMKELNRVALETGVHIFVVSHPRNVEGDNIKIQMHHLKGSSGIKQESHNIISLWRKRRPDRSKKPGEENQLVSTVLKCRSERGEEGRCLFRFERPSCRYEEVFEVQEPQEASPPKDYTSWSD